MPPSLAILCRSLRPVSAPGWPYETVLVIIFTVAYAARLWTAVNVQFWARLLPGRRVSRGLGVPISMIDLMAILPFYLGAWLALDLRVLRVLRLLRFFKLSR
jgi:voltage-gated potassium channel